MPVLGKKLPAVSSSVQLSQTSGSRRIRRPYARASEGANSFDGMLTPVHITSIPCRSVERRPFR